LIFVAPREVLHPVDHDRRSRELREALSQQSSSEAIVGVDAHRQVHKQITFALRMQLITFEACRYFPFLEICRRGVGIPRLRKYVIPREFEALLEAVNASTGRRAFSHG
jgi:hypothetical protein